MPDFQPGDQVIWTSVSPKEIFTFVQYSLYHNKEIALVQYNGGMYYAFTEKLSLLNGSGLSEDMEEACFQ